MSPIEKQVYCNFSMAEEPQRKDEDVNCPMYQRPKRTHTQQELEVCQRKMQEFKEKTTGGAGVQ